MHICFITASMVGGGTERVIAVLANYFVKQNNKVTILLTASDKIEYELDPQIEVIELGGETGRKLSGRLQRITKLRKYLRKNKDTVYLSFGTETNMFSIISALFMNRKVIVSERSNPLMCSFSRSRNFVYSFARRLAFQTPDAMNCFPKRIRKRGVVIPNPVSDLIPVRYEGERRKEIVAVGRLRSEKNHRLLLEAYADFSRVVPGYSLKIYGKGPLKEELEACADELGIIESVCFADFDANVLEKIRDSAMYVLSSNYEGISNSLLEAMTMGLPVISTDCPIGGSRMLINDHENGVLIPVGDRTALANAMIELAKDKDMAEKLSVEAAKTREKYSVERVANMWKSLATGD